jgi:hypothetical protein
MFDQLFESFRKASEASMQMQQDVFKSWSQHWLSGPPNAAGLSAEWGRTFQKRGLELLVESLNKHRESLDSAYKTGIEVIEQAFSVSEARSSEDYRRMVEELWRKLYETFKDQSEAHLHDFQTFAERSFEMVRKADVEVGNAAQASTPRAEH